MVTLDRTAFFAEGGGQPSDTGRIIYAERAIAVTHVSEKHSIITHECDQELPVGGSVHGVIDYETRFRRMQNHSGEHIISGIAHSLYGCENVGFHMGTQDVTIDFDKELSEQQVREIERRANAVVWRNVEFTNIFPTADELEGIEFRSKKELTGQVRLVSIEGCDVCACCAPHVKRAGEIGIIKILFFIRYKGGVRLHVLCGADALEYLSATEDEASAVSRMLSVKHHEIAEGVQRIADELAAAKRKNAEMAGALIERCASGLTQTDGNVVIMGNSLDGGQMRALANRGAAISDGICAVFSAKEGGYAYVMSSAKTDMRAMSREINGALNGRGGGSPEMIQGSCSCTKREILDYFKVDEAVDPGI